MAQAVGAKAGARLAAAQVLYSCDVQSPLACKRGDLVVVHCVSGSIVVKMKAKALAGARDGELVQVVAEDSKTPITVRMNGPQRAVLVSSSADSTPRSGADQ